jgi:hypothetical protein
MRFDFCIRLAKMALLVLPLAAYPQTNQNIDPCQQDIRYRWDLIRVRSFNPTVLFPGGTASALANDGSKITLSGRGTFDPCEPADVTGRGRWTTFDSSGVKTGSGTYRVTELIRFNLAPGFNTASTIDNIPGATGDLTDNRAGLVFLKITYSDGSKGVLVVSCDLPGGPGSDRPGAPASIFEGITASKGYVDYWNRVAPMPNVDGNRTLFHVRVSNADAANPDRDPEPDQDSDKQISR